MSPPRRRDREELVRPYLITGGRAHPTRRALHLTTLVYATTDTETAGLSPEEQRAMRLCAGGSLAVAEIAAHLALPVSVTKVLVADLADAGKLATFAPHRADAPDRELLQEVLDGLRALG